MGLWGESQVSNEFPKIVDKIPDDRGWNRGKPGVNSVTLQRGVSESLRICLQSSYSRLCGGNRWLPLLAFEERRRGQVLLNKTTNPRHGAEDCSCQINVNLRCSFLYYSRY